MKKIRAFWAIDLPDDIKEQIELYCDQLRTYKLFARVKWTRIENLHITVRFLGNITSEQYEKMVLVAQQELEDFTNFELNFANLKLFPNDKHPLALVIEPEAKSLYELNKIFENIAVTCGCKPEKRDYRPHLTLGKIKFRWAETDLPKVSLPRDNFIVDNVKLFKSESDNGGSKYTVIKSLKFNWR